MLGYTIFAGAIIISLVWLFSGGIDYIKKKK